MAKDICLNEDYVLFLNDFIIYFNIFILILIILINLKNIKKVKKIIIFLFITLFINITINMCNYNLTYTELNGCTDAERGFNFFKKNLFNLN